MTKLLDALLYEKYMLVNSHLYLDKGYDKVTERGYSHAMLVLHRWVNGILT